ALAAGANRARLAEQQERFHPGVAIDGASADSLAELATGDDVDLVIVATGGILSLRPVLGALATGKVVATANKETLVAGGHLVMPLARALAMRPAAERGRTTGSGAALTEAWSSPLAWLRPIDSEHSAIWQCLAGEQL